MDDEAASSSPTPEVAAYRAQKEVAERSAHQIWRSVALFLGAVMLVVVGALLYVATTVGQIDATVNSHTTTLNCQKLGYDAILKDAKLALTGDKDPNDYAKAPPGC